MPDPVDRQAAGPLTLRELAIVLDQGRQAADRLQDPGLTAALSAMTETAVILAIEPNGEIWNVDTDFAELVTRYVG